MENTNTIPQTEEREEVVLLKKQLKTQKHIAGALCVLCVVMVAIGLFLAIRLSGTITVLDQTLKDLDHSVETLNMDQVNEAVDNLNRTISPIVNLIETLQ